MLFLFDNNGIDYWIHNNINDCCNPNVSHNTYQNIKLEYKVETPAAQHEIQMNRVNNIYKQKNVKHNKNIDTDTNYTSQSNVYYNSKQSNTYNRKYEYNSNNKERAYFTYNNFTYNNNSSHNKHMQYNLNEKRVKTVPPGSYEQPKLINL